MMIGNKNTLNSFETRLDSFDNQVRKEALTALCELADSGTIPIEPEKEIANLHCHSFFSFNGYGYSPSHLAWLGKKHGLKLMGIVDFDVLDGVDEFLDACEYVGIRGTAGMETRVCIPEFGQYEINSPGEPGVCYHMGTGFTSSSVPDSIKSTLGDVRLRVEQRNRQMLDKINQFLDPLYLDYEEDILPLTPSGNATERHMVHKIAEKAAHVMDDPILYWSQKLEIPLNDIKREIKDPNKFNNTLRKKLMKRGSVGYIQPTINSFPLIDDFHKIVSAAQALPCFAWLDGISQGEQAIEALLEHHLAKGAAAINIVPDRNWNIVDPNEKEAKLSNLYQIVALANDLNLPILVGTEMNQFGQKMVDDFFAPELEPVRESFVRGAYFLYGHTQMQRRWGMGYQSEWAKRYLPDRKVKNEFFEAVGRLIPPGFNSAVIDLDAYTTLKPALVLKQLKEK
jgi:hypothetical protein